MPPAYSSQASQPAVLETRPYELVNAAQRHVACTQVATMPFEEQRAWSLAASCCSQLLTATTGNAVMTSLQQG